MSSPTYHRYRGIDYRVERDPKGLEHEWRVLIIRSQGWAGPPVEMDGGSVDDCDTEEEALEAAHNILNQLA